jgi:hypothetical protein
MTKKIFGCIFLFLSAGMLYLLFCMLPQLIMLAVQILRIINSQEINAESVGRVIGEATFWGIFSILLFLFIYFGVKWVRKSNSRPTPF